MKDTAVETVLHMNDFTKYFEKKRLGKLYFPNGRYLENFCKFSNFFINLADLYKLVSGWRVNHTLVSLESIVAVIAFGSAVRYPDIKEVPYVRRKYLLFGQKVTGVYHQKIQPRDADFLVITKHNLIREEVLEPISEKTYHGDIWLKRGGIHLVNRGVSQVLKGVQANDTVSVSALQEGVPIFFNGQLDDMVVQVGITKATPRKIIWDENSKGFLVGNII